MNNQKHQMKWILFWVFLSLFITMVLCTLSTVFLGFGAPTEEERNLLVKMLMVEVATAVIALFYSIFGIKNKSEPEDNSTNEKIQELILEIGKLEKRIGTLENISPTTPEIESKEITTEFASALTLEPFQIDTIIENFSIEPPFPIDEYRLKPLPKEIEDDISKSKPFDMKHRAQSYVGTKIQWKLAFRTIIKREENLYTVRAQAGFLHSISFEIDEESSFLLRHLDLDSPFWVCGEIEQVNTLDIDLKNVKIYSGE